MRMLPDFQMELVQSIEFILSSELSRKAFESPPFDNFGNIIRDVIHDIDRLADNCHMPEFTDHALPHICSLVKRVSEWGVADAWLSQLTPAEAGYLLFSILVHDIGMLSQNPADLLNDQERLSLGLADVATWVRQTHVDRIEGLLIRLADSSYWNNIVTTDHFRVIIALAKAHQSWPWQKGFTDIKSLCHIDQERLKGLAAIIAVADLLDEGSNRCDTITLIKHRQGSLMNKAHWVRHSLTDNWVGVSRKTIEVNFVKPPGSENELQQVYRALRNHYRLVKLYDTELNVIHAGIERINFNTSYGVPEDNWSYHESWESLQTWLLCPTEQLLMTFMPEARNEDSSPEEKKQFEKIGLELLDLENYKKFIGQKELLTDEEMIFYKLYNS